MDAKTVSLPANLVSKGRGRKSWETDFQHSEKNNAQTFNQAEKSCPETGMQAFGPS
jgi:hypothetical protein